MHVQLKFKRKPLLKEIFAVETNSGLSLPLNFSPLLTSVFLEGSGDLSLLHVKIRIRHKLCISKHLLFLVYLYKAHFCVRAVTMVYVPLLPFFISLELWEGEKLISYECFLLHICSHVKGPF